MNSEAIRIAALALQAMLDASAVYWRYTNAVESARKEGREITPEEMASLRAENQRMVDAILKD